MKFFVEILEINPKTREVKVLAEYSGFEARGLEDARHRGLEQYEREHPGVNWDMVYGKARPA